ncbi:MAG: peptide ABC transporter substrate-binding protein [Phycisphaerales bacterium]|nr:peptide ABC transporter substrate-binding protein [Phycisphaerales bacterium]
MIRGATAALIGSIAVLLAWLGLRAQTERAEFVVASDEEPRTIDPHRVSLLGEIQIANACWEGLTRLNPETFLPEPAVAEKWDFDAESLTYVFHLRETARWSNGEPLTAEHFRYSWLRSLDPRLGGQYYALLLTLRGAAEYYQSRANDDPADDLPATTVGVEALDERTLRVVLARPCAYFLDLTSFATLYPVYPPGIEHWRGANGRIPQRQAHLWTRPEHIVCNGAFVPQRWEFKKRVLLRANAHYWDSASIGVRSIEFYSAADANAALLAYETGRVDFVRSIPKTTARALYADQQAGRRADLHSGPRFATFFFRVNCSRPPLNDAELRKALWLAMDRETLADKVMGMGEQPAYTYVPRASVPDMPRRTADGRTVLYQPPAGLGAGLTAEQREALAREHLARSAYAKEGMRRPIEIMYAPFPDYQRVAESVQSMWERVLKIPVALRVQEAKVLSSEVRNLRYDVVRSDWYGDYMDPGTFLDMFSTGNGQNRTGWSHPRYDELIAAAAEERDDERRYALFAEAERILCEEQAPIIPLFVRSGAFLLNPAFEGLRDNVQESFPVHRVRRAAQRP